MDKAGTRATFSCTLAVSRLAARVPFVGKQIAMADADSAHDASSTPVEVALPMPEPLHTHNRRRTLRLAGVADRWILAPALVSLLVSEATAHARGPRATAPEEASEPPSAQPPLLPLPGELLRAVAGGMTADEAGRRAMDSSFAVRQALASMRSAEARVDEAWVGFLPKLTGTANYTRVSQIYPSSITFPLNTNISVPQSVPSLGGQTIPVSAEVVIPGSQLVPTILDHWTFQGRLTIPLSDYVLDIDHNYEAAQHSADAARLDASASRATALSNGKIAYYSWLQARGGVVVSIETLNDQRVHLADARNEFNVGNASRADVLRAETAAAQSELALVQAQDAADLADAQLRIALHLSPSAERLVPGEALDTPVPTFQGNLQSLINEGLSNRGETRSLSANIEAARQTATVNRAGRYPTVIAFGDLVEANPNQRFFPVQATFNTTWDVGVQASWSPNDALWANAASRDYDARASALEAQAQATRENLIVEITKTFHDVRESEISVDISRRELASAKEAYRVARELFTSGRGSAITLTDAERDLFTARIDALTASVNVRIAHVRLEHSVARDLALLSGRP